MPSMPKQTLRTHQLRIELEVTPDWWTKLGGRALGCSEDELNRRSGDLIARSMLLATAAFESSEVRVSRSAFKLIAFVPTDTTFAAVSERAGELRDRMNALENPGSQP